MTKYPILLVHGMGFRDRKRLCYWGRVARALEEHGARVYFGGQDSNGSVESNARQLEAALKNALADSGAEKVNIFAHSKGGLEARLLISGMGYANRVASLSTFSTPHNGSITVDRLMRLAPQWLIRAACAPVDLWFRLLGDKSPDTYSAICAFRTADAQRFNKAYPDCAGVYTQSFGFVMKNARSDMLMALPWLVVRCFEGDNDGLLAPRAVSFGVFRGVFSGTGRRGISHCDETDARRRRLCGTPPKAPHEISDITQFYLGVAQELAEIGL